MTPPALEAPPQPQERPAPPSAPAPQRTRFAPRRSPTGRLTHRALLASAVTHVVAALVLWQMQVPPGPGAAAFEAPSPPVSPEQVSYIDLAEFPAGVPDAVTAPEPAGEGAPQVVATSPADSTASRFAFPAAAPRGTSRAAPAAQTQGGSVSSPSTNRAAAGATSGGASGGAGRPLAAGAGAGQGRLNPEYGDVRLHIPPREIREPELTDEERYILRLAARLQAHNDSTAAGAERERRARDWTYTDSKGRKWGFGPGGTVVVNGKVLPIPPISLPPGDRQHTEAARREREQRAEIDRQAESIQRDRHMKERIRATRERADAERRRRRGS